MHSTCGRPSWCCPCYSSSGTLCTPRPAPTGGGGLRLGGGGERLGGGGERLGGGGEVLVGGGGEGWGGGGGGGELNTAPLMKRVTPRSPLRRKDCIVWPGFAQHSRGMGRRGQRSSLRREGRRRATHEKRVASSHSELVPLRPLQALRPCAGKASTKAAHSACGRRGAGLEGGSTQGGRMHGSSSVSVRLCLPPQGTRPGPCTPGSPSCCSS